MTRLSCATGRTFDLLIVGGGIIGAGIARDAALRGLDVALFEQADFAGGTTAGSTRLIHGGLRYLEMLDFPLVRLDLRERETLLRIAPHLVRPLEFLMPLYDRSRTYRWKLALGMFVYDLLSYDRSLPRHRWLTRQQVLSEEPYLRDRHLQGAVAYYDAQVNLPERLCLENLIDAREHGAGVFNYSEVLDARRTGSTITGLRVRDVLSGEDAEIAGRVAVNAAGPWLDRVAGRLTQPAAPRVRTTKGIHVACPPVTQRALVLFSPLDGRLIFALPWLGYTWIGTTDTDFTGDPRDAIATEEDVDYLLRSASEFLPTLDPTRIVFSNAGVRALVMDDKAPSEVSRQHRIVDEARHGAAGLISVLGGKITGYRAIAQEVTDVVCRHLRVSRRCRTAEKPLPGARSADAPDASVPRVGQATLDHLASLYGSRAVDVLRLATADPRLAEPLAPGGPDIGAQVAHAVRNEHCLRVSDFLLRRTRLGFSADQGRLALSRVATLLGEELGWKPSRRDSEIDAYLAHVARTQAFRLGVTDLLSKETSQ